MRLLRLLTAISSLVVLPCFTAAQDTAVEAAQQAAQQSQQAALEAMRDAQEASRQASQAAQQAIPESRNSLAQPCCLYVTAPPKFSVKPGSFSGPTTVKITDSTREAVIYYTTDGWTPTLNSTRYRGPILIGSTTRLQAVAVAPYAVRSLVTSGEYVISGTAAAALATGAATENEVRLAFTADVNSRTASVGDRIPLALTEDVQVGNLLVKKGATATATIIGVDSSGIGGAPGRLAFEVESLDSESGPIALRGGATKEGDAKPPNAAILIPFVGPFTVFKHGTDAVIAKGTPFIARLDRNAGGPHGN